METTIDVCIRMHRDLDLPIYVYMHTCTYNNITCAHYVIHLRIHVHIHIHIHVHISLVRQGYARICVSSDLSLSWTQLIYVRFLGPPGSYRGLEGNRGIHYIGDYVGIIFPYSLQTPSIFSRSFQVDNSFLTSWISVS